MAELIRPFQMLWEWIDRTGGYPGKMVFICLLIMLVLGGLTWYSNRK